MFGMDTMSDVVSYLTDVEEYMNMFLIAKKSRTLRCRRCNSYCSYTAKLCICGYISGTSSDRAGFVWADLLTNLERTADHCSNIAVCVIDSAKHNMNIHESLKTMKHNNSYFDEKYEHYKEKYCL